MKKSFESFPVNTKVQSLDKDGYFISNICGYIAKHLSDGHAIIKSFSGGFYSTIGYRNVSEVVAL